MEWLHVSPLVSGLPDDPETLARMNAIYEAAVSASRGLLAAPDVNNIFVLLIADTDVQTFINNLTPFDRTCIDIEGISAARYLEERNRPLTTRRRQWVDPALADAPTRTAMRQEAATRAREQGWNPAVPAAEGEDNSPEANRDLGDASQNPFSGQMASKRMAKAKKVEEAARMEMETYSPPDDLVSRLADDLLQNDAAFKNQMRNKIHQLNADLATVRNEVANLSLAHRLEDFMAKKLAAVLENALSQESVKERKAYFAVLNEISGVDTAFMESIFTENARKVLSPDAGRLGAKVRLDTAIKAMVKVEAELESTTQAMGAAQKDRQEAVKAQVKNQMEALGGLPFVNDLKFTGGFLIVKTKDAEFDWEGYHYNIGPYQIKVRTSGASQDLGFNIKSLHLGKLANGVEHPHVINNGENICWGNVREGVIKLRAAGDWPTLFTVLWNYICSYNPNSRFNELAHFITEILRKPLSEARTRIVKKKEA